MTETTTPASLLPHVVAGTTPLQVLVREAIAITCKDFQIENEAWATPACDFEGGMGEWNTVAHCHWCNGGGYVLRSPYGDPERDAAAKLAVVCLALDGYDPDLARHIYLIGADDIDGAWEAVKAALESEATHG